MTPTKNDAAPLAGEARRDNPNEQQNAIAFQPVEVSKLIREYPILRPVVIEGMLRGGEVMNIVAAPKVGKSWLGNVLAVAVASGTLWLGRKTKQERVLLIDAELHCETLADRFRAMIAPDANLDLEVWPVRGRRLTIEDIAAALRAVPRGKYGLIVLDALYRFLPLNGEENSNETMTRIYNMLDAIAQATGAVVVIVHHANKGNQSGKLVTDVGAGAGAQSRAADTHLILRAHEADDAVVVDAAVRSFPPMDSFVVRNLKPGWELAPELDPTKLRTAGQRKEKAPPREPDRAWTPQEFATEVVGRERSIRADVIERARTMNLSKSKAEDLLKRAIAAGLVYRHCDGPSAPHRFSIDPPVDHADAGEGRTPIADPAPRALRTGGYGGKSATPLPPSVTTDTGNGRGAP